MDKSLKVFNKYAAAQNLSKTSKVGRKLGTRLAALTALILGTGYLMSRARRPERWENRDAVQTWQQRPIIAPKVL